MDEREIAWFAGLFEGEGTICMLNRPNIPSSKRLRSRSATFTVAMTDRDVVERVANMIGTKISPCPRPNGRKMIYRATIRGAGAIEWMKILYPYLGERRRAKINEIIEEWDGATSFRAYRGSGRRKEFSGFIKEIEILKGRGE